MFINTICGEISKKNLARDTDVSMPYYWGQNGGSSLQLYSGFLEGRLKVANASHPLNRPVCFAKQEPYNMKRMTS